MRLEHPEEEALYVDLAAHLDEGVAISGAFAMHRGCFVATDDRKARRILRQFAPTLPLLSTLELLKQWADECRVAINVLRQAMLDMQSGASYLPGARDPLFEWWRSIVSGPDS